MNFSVAKSIVSLQKRSFILYARRSNRLESFYKEANLNPSDASKQTALYKELYRQKDYDSIVKRIESKSYQLSPEAFSFYMQAKSQNGSKLGHIASSAWNLMHGPPQELCATTSLSGNTILTGLQNAVVILRPDAWQKAMTILKYVFLFVVLIMLNIATKNLQTSLVDRKVKMFAPGEENVKFSDVEGCEEAKEELMEIIEFLRNPQKFTQLGGKLPKGVLLSGPPGTGKTMLAKAIAGEAGVPFLYASGSEFDEMFVGLGASRLRHLFSVAKKIHPCIIFIDEIETLGSQRSASDRKWDSQTLNQLLAELDGFSSSEGIIFIAATNFPERLDKALTRPGRIDKLVEVPLPDARGRMNILRKHLEKVKLPQKFDVDSIARGTPGFSGAQLANLVNEALNYAARQNASSLNLEHLEWAKDKTLMGSERKSMVLNDKVKKAIAYHEAGHTIVSYFTTDADPLHKVTILPRGHALGMTVHLPESDKVLHSSSDAKARLDGLMGGRAAEELAYGHSGASTGCSNDFKVASDIARSMVMNYGMSEKVGKVYFSEQDLKLASPETLRMIDDEVKVMIDSAHARAVGILQENRELLDALADQLLMHETLSKEEVERILSNKLN